MKWYLVGALVMLVAMTGCNDDAVTPLTPGNPDDPEFESFMSEFETIDDGTGLMFTSMLEMVDGILSTEPGGPVAVASEFAYTLEYDEVEKHWVSTLEGTDEESGFSISLLHTLQFIQDGSPVQYPDPDLVDRISSSSEMELSGEGIASAGGAQDITVDITHFEEDVLLTVNGEGESHADVTHTEVTESGTTTCSADMAFDTAITGIQLWGSSSEGCPIAGTVVYNGSASVACSGGENEFSASGRWTVTQTFDEGIVSLRVVSGGNVWETEEACF